MGNSIYQSPSRLYDGHRASSLLPPMPVEHLQSLKFLFYAALTGSATIVNKIAALTAPNPQLDTYIERGGTALAIALLIAAIVYLVKENRAMQNRIETLHTAQIAETAKSTEARLAQTAAVENTNRIVAEGHIANSKLAEAVNRLAEKVKG